MPDKLAPSSYRKLLSEIASLYEGARKALVEAYWKIGQRIVGVEQEGAIKAVYGTGLLQRLSEDLTKKLGQGFSESNLRRMRQFYLAHPKQPPAVELTWTQYAELLPIESAIKKARLIQKAIREHLDSKALRKLVQAELVREEVAENLAAFLETREPPELLVPVRGTLFTYRIIQPKLVGAGVSELLIDLGFSSYRDLDNVTDKPFKPGDIVISAKDAKGNYSLREIRPSTSPPEDGSVQRFVAEKTGSQKGAADLYSYKAEVEKVVDGDTLRVVVDLGFGFKTRQYLRLRGLDCPEMDTRECKNAAEFVKARIKQADEIVLTSSRSDKYDRYLADVFFADANGNEQYLNNLLLQAGLAVNVSQPLDAAYGQHWKWRQAYLINGIGCFARHRPVYAVYGFQTERKRFSRSNSRLNSFSVGR